jgi:DNA-binding Lrp family transcriptional regulator
MTDAFLFINVQFLFIDDVMNKLKEIPEIINVHKVQGTYDIIARVHSDTEEKLKELVSERIRRIDSIIGKESKRQGEKSSCGCSANSNH